MSSYNIKGKAAHIYGARDEFDSVLEAMEELSIFSVKKTKDGNFLMKEECDCYFDATLTKEQLKSLGEELIKLSEI